MSAMRIAHAGYASAKAVMILGLMNLFARGSGKRRSATMQMSAIAPAAMPAYDVFFSVESLRQCVSGCAVFMASITLLSLSCHHERAFRIAGQGVNSDDCESYTIQPFLTSRIT